MAQANPHTLVNVIFTYYLLVADRERLELSSSVLETGILATELPALTLTCLTLPSFNPVETVGLEPTSGSGHEWLFEPSIPFAPSA